MAEAAEKKSAKEIVNIDKEIQKANERVLTKVGGGMGGSLIKTRDKIFTLPDGTQNDALRVVIVHFMTRHMYYDKPFNANNPASPKCWAVGEDKDNLAPPTSVEEPESDECATCPQFEWGSAPTGGNVPR